MQPHIKLPICMKPKRQNHSLDKKSSQQEIFTCPATMRIRQKFLRSELRTVSNSLNTWKPSDKKSNHLPYISDALPVLKLSRHQVVLAKNQDKLWAYKIIALFLRNNNLWLSSNKQFELSQLHPDVLVQKMLKLAKVKHMNRAATKIQRATRLFLESLRKMRTALEQCSAAS